MGAASEVAGTAGVREAVARGAARAEAAVTAGDKKARRAAEKVWKSRVPCSEVATSVELAEGAPVRWFLRWAAAEGK